MLLLIALPFGLVFLHHLARNHHTDQLEAFYQLPAKMSCLLELDRERTVQRPPCYRLVR